MTHHHHGFHGHGCCPSHLFVAAARTAVHLGAGLAAHLCGGHDHDCHPSCLDGADVLVYALPGERRVVPFQVRNDSHCPLRVTPKVEVEATGGGASTAGVVFAVEGKEHEVAPCGTAEVDLVIELARARACQCVSARLTFEGTNAPPVRVGVYVGGKLPAVVRHDLSRLRAWVRDFCFRRCGHLYVAPPPVVAGCACGCGHHGDGGHHGHHG